MASNLKLGIVGLVHDHVWGLLNQFNAIERVKIEAAADSNPPLLETVKTQFGVSKLYTDFLEMLSKEDLDAVLLCTENSRHADVVEAAAERGIHVIMEKPMAATLEQAERIVKSSEKYGIKVMVNYPTTWSPAVQQAYKMVKEDKIGDIFHIRFRGAHAGPKETGCSPYFYNWLYNKELNGAGAIIDYCCYGVNLSCWFLGDTPKSVIGVMGTLARTYLEVDDNAMIIMNYKNAWGIAEACWSQVGSHPIHGPIINGVNGSLIVDEEGRLHFYAVKKKGDYRDIQGEVLEPPMPPKGWRNGPEYFVERIEKDEEISDPLSVRFNRDVQEILEAGIHSAVEGKRINLPL
ncbi:gfo/Idh/MocA family oxidoreductase [Candidatus Bathyarchaeota archaeon]|nr:MAG: gfo/Idh/MocA family oxidoreductase [Candidatus Bathyarchaeota archaeon]